uniref:Transposable element Tc3 transposase putative n=1 Tax=Albugo laibachii Nc14 TaxID=890382 RepID=F0X0H7_9STRA|nr:Transposable element Tc3 transposase putative [Albugo laibachii Nc14]|eukprot:CCA27267.1 Transposable element Tc3 transposase putative [Albugo laibachii Nc14]
MSSRIIALALDHVVKRTTVLRVLRASKFASYIKRKPTPHLKKHHKAKRIPFAKKHLNKVEFWERVLFTDENKFNLDGPGGCQYYWHVILKDPETYSRRGMRGGSVLVWAGVCQNGKTKIAFLEGKQTAVKYTQTILNYLCLFLQELQDNHGIREPIFQQDGASIHTAKSTQTFLSIHNIKILEWPAKSPDLNIIESVWGDPARSVYAGGRQFTCREDLTKQIEVSWRQVSVGYLKRLVEDMPTRIAKVIIRGGAGIDR